MGGAEMLSKLDKIEDVLLAQIRDLRTYRFGTPVASNRASNSSVFTPWPKHRAPS